MKIERLLKMSVDSFLELENPLILECEETDDKIYSFSFYFLSEDGEIFSFSLPSSNFLLTNYNKQNVYDLRKIFKKVEEIKIKGILENVIFVEMGISRGREWKWEHNYIIFNENEKFYIERVEKQEGINIKKNFEKFNAWKVWRMIK